MIISRAVFTQDLTGSNPGLWSDDGLTKSYSSPEVPFEDMNQRQVYNLGAIA